MRDYLFPPLLFPFFILLVVLPFFFLIFLFATSHVFQIIFGLSYGDAIAVFSLIVLGSLINIPMYEKEGRIVVRRYNFFGFIYSVKERKRTTVAVNVGGCIIPSILAIKLLFELPPIPWALTFALSSAIIYLYARPVEGLGIAVPTFIPPLASAVIGYASIAAFSFPLLLLPKLAFSAGVLAALFGADILHLKDIEKIGSGVISIGGAGTFDGIFLTGVFAVVFSIIFL
jgi:uncharacterized membrane protein